MPTDDVLKPAYGWDSLVNVDFTEKTMPAGAAASVSI
jgi:hypothetical protein